ncbi:hypothetical protein [Sinomonas humi]|uniref:Uncharacterized protein n=1 Tax=Sinomonas humi TaxID=1338436 RepID=A0A0B2APP4_9MICC|nr:hypothetical protein [Sinomonas humi]KHL03823.1 hypothetical protein LK10_08315 [Sinomonas humi]
MPVLGSSGLCQQGALLGREVELLEGVDVARFVQRAAQDPGDRHPGGGSDNIASFMLDFGP